MRKSDLTDHLTFFRWFIPRFEKDPSQYADKAFLSTRWTVLPGMVFSAIGYTLIPVDGHSPVVYPPFLILLPALGVVWLASGFAFYRFLFAYVRETLTHAEVWDVSDRADHTAKALIRFPLSFTGLSWLSGILLLMISGGLMYGLGETGDKPLIIRGLLVTLLGLNVYAITEYLVLCRMIAPVLRWLDEKKFRLSHLPIVFYDEPFVVYTGLALISGIGYGLLIRDFLSPAFFWWLLCFGAGIGVWVMMTRYRQWNLFHRHLETETTNGSQTADSLLPALWVLIQRVNTMKRLFYDLLLNIENNSSEMNAAARVVAETSTEQNAALVRQSASVTQTTSTLQELVQAAKQIAESSSAVVAFAESTQAKAETGLQVMQNAVASVQKVRQGNETNLSEVVLLSEAIIEIDQVLNFIISIADETNLIALNAAIEASSAGEQGKRFKIVANEVRNLSTRVTRSIRHVKETIRKIQEATAQLVQTVHMHQEVIDESVDWVDQSLANLEEILENAVQSADAAKQIYIAIQQQKIANQQIAASFSDISSDIRHLASASERYNQYVTALKKFSANIDQALHDLQIDRIRQKDDEWLLS